MHIVIPMSGTGERFLKAGYDRPKPLISADDAPMIKYVVSMFSASDKFTFICNSDHLKNSNLSQVLKEIAPNGNIVAIAPHKKGPVYAVQQCFELIDDSEEVIVNYCDFYSYWDYQDFLKTCRADGAIPAYRGFHPHMLHGDNYAFIKDTGGRVEAIQEKQPFTDNRMNEYASNGTYYFGSGRLVKKYFQALIDSGDTVNGEFYVSMVYNRMIADGLTVIPYEVQHMLQWGTPRDLEEYQHWSNYFSHLSRSKEKKEVAAVSVDTGLIPMAGAGVRFKNEGYSLPKPMIAVSGKPMIVQAVDNLPPAKRYVFVAQAEHLAEAALAQTLKTKYANTSIVTLDGLSQGQAISCQVGLLGAVPPVEPDKSLLVGACDNGMLFDASKWNTLIRNSEIDVAAFSFRHHPSSKRNPQMYGWLQVEDRDVLLPEILHCSVKKAVSDNPGEDHAIVGAFYFRRAADFLEAVEKLQEENIRVNGEFYVDSMINVLLEMKRRCVAFEVDDYICFGTPDDLRTFQYWQSFFHKCSWHPYTIEKDPQANTQDRELVESVSQARGSL